jgi:hypothetical protein
MDQGLDQGKNRAKLVPRHRPKPAAAKPAETATLKPAETKPAPPPVDAGPATKVVTLP